MKKLFTIIAILMAVVVSAQQPQQKLTRKQKRYIKTAQKLDVLKYLPERSDQNPSTFWNNVVLNNTELQKELKRFDEPIGLAASACDKVRRIYSDWSLRNMSYRHNNAEEINETFKSVMLGDNCKRGNVTFRIDGSKELNAYTTVDGYIYICYGLLEALNSDFAMVNGVLAHEVTHYLFQHTLLHEYNVLCRQRANNIAAAISIAAIGAANIAAAANGAPTDAESQKKAYQGIIDGANEWTEAYYYRYGREEELVSDIVAYRFLEWTGLDPEKFIQTLEKINGPWMNRETDRYDDHPSPEDRIGVLRALTPAPWRIKKE